MLCLMINLGALTGRGCWFAHGILRFDADRQRSGLFLAHPAVLANGRCVLRMLGTEQPAIQLGDKLPGVGIGFAE